MARLVANSKGRPRLSSRKEWGNRSNSLGLWGISLRVALVLLTRRVVVRRAGVVGVPRVGVEGRYYRGERVPVVIYISYL